MFPFQKILVGLARTRLDGDLVSYASLLAGFQAERQVQVQFVHILDDTAAASADQAQEELEEVVRLNFRPSTNTAFASVKILHGTRIDRLLEYSADRSADLLLVGHHSNRTGRRSLARRLAMNAPCSLWMVPEGAAARMDRILAAVDFSIHSAYALSIGSAVAASAGLAECFALHVYFDQSAALVDHTVTCSHNGVNRRLRRFLAPLNLNGVSVKRLLQFSPSVPAGVHRAAEASNADLLVMGTRGLSPSVTVLLGSESEQVLRESPIPVLVVKEPGERIGFLRALFDPEAPRSSVRFG